MPSSFRQKHRLICFGLAKPDVQVSFIRYRAGFRVRIAFGFSESEQNGRKTMKLSIKLAVAGFASVALFALPAMSAPLSIFPNGVSVDIQALQAQARAVARGGVHRGAAVRHGTAYRGGAAVRRGAVVGGAAVVGSRYYGGGYCDPNYQYCGGGAYTTGVGVYRGGAAVTGGAVVRGGAAVRRGGAHVAHRRR
jgi:hypothetical protein